MQMDHYRSQKFGKQHPGWLNQMEKPSIDKQLHSLLDSLGGRGIEEIASGRDESSHANKHPWFPTAPFPQSCWTPKRMEDKVSITKFGNPMKGSNSSLWNENGVEHTIAVHGQGIVGVKFPFTLQKNAQLLWPPHRSGMKPSLTPQHLGQRSQDFYDGWQRWRTRTRGETIPVGSPRGQKHLGLSLSKVAGKMIAWFPNPPSPPLGSCLSGMYQGDYPTLYSHTSPSTLR